MSVEIKIAEKRFSEHVVLQDIALSLVPGSFTAIAGPSGCGKTTLLRIIAGLDHRYSGKVITPERLGFVFQEPTLLPWLTVRDNISVTGHGDANRLLKAVGLEASGALYPRALSLGMARRVSLARALSVSPELLLLDEPFVSLDKETASDMRALLKRLWQEQRFTCLMITHDLAEAEAIAERIVLLGGSPATIRSDRRIHAGDRANL
jgi:ABC-type nitrate/sulfonate/bicarbonate transport system ATPase subunit